jgi:hypothetical protein
MDMINSEEIELGRGFQPENVRKGKGDPGVSDMS